MFSFPLYCRLASLLYLLYLDRYFCLLFIFCLLPLSSFFISFFPCTSHLELPPHSIHSPFSVLPVYPFCNVPPLVPTCSDPLPANRSSIIFISCPRYVQLSVPSVSPPPSIQSYSSTHCSILPFPFFSASFPFLCILFNFCSSLLVFSRPVSFLFIFSISVHPFPFRVIPIHFFSSHLPAFSGPPSSLSFLYSFHLSVLLLH